MAVTIPELPATIAPPPAPFSHVSIGTGEVVHIAGQTARGGPAEDLGDIGEQTERVFAKIEALLAAVDLDVSAVAAFRVYLVDAADLPGFNAARRTVYDRLFPDGAYPPNTVLVVSALASPELLIEIEAVALR